MLLFKTTKYMYKHIIMFPLQDTVSYSMFDNGGFNGNTDAITYFYVEPNTGNVYLRRMLMDTTVTRFTVSKQIDFCEIFFL